MNNPNEIAIFVENTALYFGCDNETMSQLESLLVSAFNRGEDLELLSDEINDLIFGSSC